jgi:hypothetical protein
MATSFGPLSWTLEWKLVGNVVNLAGYFKLPALGVIFFVHHLTSIAQERSFAFAFIIWIGCLQEMCLYMNKDYIT